MIHFASAVRLKVSLASYIMLKDLLINARGGSGCQNVTSRYSAGRSLFPSVAGSLIGYRLASRSVYSLPTFTETEATNVVMTEVVLEEPCSSRQPDAHLAMGPEGSEKPRTDSFKTLQQNKSNEKKRESRMRKWSREGRLNPLLPSGDDKCGYVFTEEKLELGSFVKMFPTGPDDPLEIKNCFYCMLCGRNVFMGTHGLYELKHHYQKHRHFRAD